MTHDKIAPSLTNTEERFGKNIIFKKKIAARKFDKLQLGYSCSIVFLF